MKGKEEIIYVRKVLAKKIQKEYMQRTNGSKDECCIMGYYETDQLQLIMTIVHYLVSHSRWNDCVYSSLKPSSRQAESDVQTVIRRISSSKGTDNRDVYSILHSQFY